MEDPALQRSNVLAVDDVRWAAAQEFEIGFARRSANAGDDYNEWWRGAFERYRVLRKIARFQSVIEVGCGPHTNLRLILPLIRCEQVWLEDPLIEDYLRLRRERRVLGILPLKAPLAVANIARSHRAHLLREKLEDLSLPDESIDLCVCINVLDHVQDAGRCLGQVRRVLRPGGVLVLGQDLSNEEDMDSCPESWSDAGHPIKVDAPFLDSHVDDMAPLMKSILPREQGRNPRCHYGTYLLIGRRLS